MAKMPSRSVTLISRPTPWMRRAIRGTRLEKRWWIFGDVDARFSANNAGRVGGNEEGLVGGSK